MSDISDGLTILLNERNQVSQQWYYMKDGRKRGPVAADKLKELADSTQLSPTDLCCEKGASGWCQARNIDGLFPATSAVPSPHLPPGRLLSDDDLRALARTIVEGYKNEDFVSHDDIGMFIGRQIAFIRSATSIDGYMLVPKFGQADREALIFWLQVIHPDY